MRTSRRHWFCALLIASSALSSQAFARSSAWNVDQAPDPAIGSGQSIEDYRRDIVINDEPQGQGVAIEVGSVWYIERAMADAINLPCARLVEREGRALCAVPASKASEEGNTLRLSVPVEAFRRTSLYGASEPALVPEITPSNLGFFNYDFNSALVSGDVSFTTSLRGGVRLEENAFDLGAVISHAASGSGSLGSTWNDLFSIGQGGDTTLIVTDAAYRRNWFDQRLSLAIGRTSMRQRGYLSGSLIDGLSLTRDNFDNQGNVRSSFSRQITGYNPTAGVLTYRLGGTVLKQIPLPAGPYNIDPAIFASLPQGGQIEIAGFDGRVTPLNLPIGSSRVQAMFKPGTWDGNVELGRMMTAGGGHVAALDLGGRYGISDAATVEAALTATPHSIALNAGADMRLPYDLGVIGINGAWQRRQLNPAFDLAAQSHDGWAVGGYYERRFGKVTLGADYQRYGGGGIIAGGYDGIRTDAALWTYSGAPLLGSLLREDIQLYIDGPLFKTGVSGSLRLRSTSYVGQPEATRYAEVQVNGGLGRWGNWGLFGRAGENGYGASTLSGNVYWSIPLGGRSRATLAYQTDRQDGESISPDRYSLSINGSTGDRWSQADTYNLTVDNLGYGTAQYSREFSNLSTSVSAFRSPDAGVNGTLMARGSVAFVDGHAVLGKATNDSIVVLKAQTLPYEDVYLGGYSKPVTRTDAQGYAILPNPLVYRPNSARVNDANVPLGLIVPDNVMPGTVHPYRGYVVPVKTQQLAPARLYPMLPADALEAGPYAEINGTQVPVEPDGSFYVEDLGKVQHSIVVSWQRGEAVRACTISEQSMRAALAGPGDAFVRKVKDIACAPAAPSAAPTNPVPVEQQPPSLPYVQISEADSDGSPVASNDAVRAEPDRISESRASSGSALASASPQ